MGNRRYEAEIEKRTEQIKSWIDANRSNEELRKLELVMGHLPKDNKHTLDIELGSLHRYARAISFLGESDSAGIFPEIRSMLVKYFPESYDPAKVLNPAEFDNAQICDMFVSAI